MDLQEENISLTDVNNLIPKDKTPQVNEKWSTQSTAKTGVMNNVLLFFLYINFFSYIILR